MADFSTKQIDMMERAIARMSNQIDDVLEFVKIQSLHTTKKFTFRYHRTILGKNK